MANIKNPEKRLAMKNLAFLAFIGLFNIAYADNQQEAAKMDLANDPRLYLEEILSVPALDWVKKHNEQTLNMLNEMGNCFLRASGSMDWTLLGEELKTFIDSYREFESFVPINACSSMECI